MNLLNLKEIKFVTGWKGSVEYSFIPTKKLQYCKPVTGSEVHSGDLIKLKEGKISRLEQVPVTFYSGFIGDDGIGKLRPKTEYKFQFGQQEVVTFNTIVLFLFKITEQISHPVYRDASEHIVFLYGNKVYIR